MRMRWSELLFAHWAVEPEVLRPFIPAGLELELFEGRAWIGLVPFRMSDVAPRMVPAVPGISEFLELNVRTYVTTGGKRGVWFFSLDAASRLAVRAARTFFHLPYYHADMDLQVDGAKVSYRSERRSGAARRPTRVGRRGLATMRSAPAASPTRSPKCAITIPPSGRAR